MIISLYQAFHGTVGRCVQMAMATAIVTLTSVSAQSQHITSPAFAVDDLRRLSISATENVKRMFRQTITVQQPDWLPQFDAIDVITVDQVRPGGIAGMDGKKRVIHLNLGTTIIAKVYSEYATIRSHYSSRHNDKCKGYVRYLGDFYKEYGRSDPEQFATDLTSPLAYCGVSDLAADRGYRNRYREIFDQTFTSVFGLILAHEYAHHLLRHVPVRTNNPAKRREIEDEADRTGSVLFDRIGSRTPAAVVFDVMLNYRVSDPFSSRRRNTSEECRFLYYLTDDARFTGASDLKTILQRYTHRIDIMERIPDITRVLDGIYRGEKPINCEILF